MCSYLELMDAKNVRFKFSYPVAILKQNTDKGAIYGGTKECVNVQQSIIWCHTLSGLLILEIMRESTTAICCHSGPSIAIGYLPACGIDLPDVEEFDL